MLFERSIRHIPRSGFGYPSSLTSSRVTESAQFPLVQAMHILYLGEIGNSIVTKMSTKHRKLRLSVLALCFLLLSVTSAGFANTARASPGIFKITLMVPASNPARQSWSLVVQSNLQSLGIDAGRVIFPFGTIISRAIVPSPANLTGKTYDNGGWDTLFIGNALGIDPDPAILYNSTNFAPNGNNYNLWNNTQADKLGTQIDQTVNKTARLALVRQWQALAQDEAPSATILYTKEIVAYDAKLPNAGTVFKVYHYPYWAPIEQLSANPVDTSIILAQTGPAPADLIPELSQSYYDTTISSVIFGSIAQRNDTIFKTMVPQLGAGSVQSPGWSVSPDGLKWTVNLRQGVTWHDGAPFNATDVKFTFDALQDDVLSAPIESFVKGIIGGKADVAVTGPYQVTFTLPHVYAYFVENILSLAILPQHVLASIPYGSWKTSSFDSGQGGPGPIGTGPYKWMGYDLPTTTSHLTRNDNYEDFPVNGKPALIARGAFQVKDYYVRYVLGSDAAISFMNTGAVDVLDSQYHLETQQNFLSSWQGGGKGYAVYDAYGIQEMAFMMKHPILGTGVDTPLGKQDPTKAALAAKYVRQAISHAIPRQLIIDQLLYGYGKPGITSAVTPATDGFNTALTPHDFNLTESRNLLMQAGYFPPPPAAAPSFIDAYGFYLITALVVAIVALAAFFVLRIRRKPLTGPSYTTASQQTPTPPPAPT